MSAKNQERRPFVNAAPDFFLEAFILAVTQGTVRVMNAHTVQAMAGFTSTTIFISSNLPMLFKTFKTKNMSSYSLWHLILGNLGNTVYWLHVSSLPVGPVWFLQAFFSLARGLMLFCYLQY